MISACNREI